MSKDGGSGRVLGNDPFKRGVAGGAETPKTPKAPAKAAAPVAPPAPVAKAAPQKPAPPPKPVIKPVMTPMKKEPPRVPPKPPAPPPPAKIVVPTPKAGAGTPARRAVTSFASRPSPSMPAPKVTAPERPSARHDPIPLIPPRPSPKAHEGSPHEVFDPKAHAGSPSIGADPIAHASSPTELFDPKSHEGSPELKAEFTPHGSSPDVVADVNAGVTAHAGSPAVVAELEHAEAVPHEGSPDVVSDRVTDLGVALGAAREVTDGLTRPLIDAAAGLFSAAKSALGFGARGAVDTWGKDETLTRSLHPVGDFLYDKYFRVTVEGADLVPEGASIIVANHSGALPLDGPMLSYALQRERADLEAARWLVEDQVFHAPVLGVLMNRIGAVRAHPENAIRLLQEGRPVIVFPEGFLGISKPFTQRYQLKRFGRGGYVKLALKQKVPIVPVAIVGAEESMPLLAKLPGGMFGLPYVPLMPPPLPARWTIRFSEPVHVDGNADDLAYVQQQNDRVRDTIAGMLESLLKK